MTKPAKKNPKKLVENETIKLEANFANNIASGAIVGGFLVPYFSFGQNPAAIHALHGWPMVILLMAFAAAMTLGFTFHHIAKRALENLE
jgi:hypothetical protein